MRPYRESTQGRSCQIRLKCPLTLNGWKRFRHRPHESYKDKRTLVRLKRDRIPALLEELRIIETVVDGRWANPDSTDEYDAAGWQWRYAGQESYIRDFADDIETASAESYPENEWVELILGWAIPGNLTAIFVQLLYDSGDVLGPGKLNRDFPLCRQVDRCLADMAIINDPKLQKLLRSPGTRLSSHARSLLHKLKAQEEQA